MAEFSKVRLDVAVFTLSLVVLGRAALSIRKLLSRSAPTGSLTSQTSALDSGFPSKSPQPVPFHYCEAINMEEKLNDEQKQTEAFLTRNKSLSSEETRALLERVLLDAFAVQSIKLGDQLGLYVAFQEAQARSVDGFVSLEQLCDMGKTDPRLTVEWLRFQARLGLLTVSSVKGERYRMNITAASCLLPPSYSNESMIGAFRIGTCMIDLSTVVKSFETGTQTLFTLEEVPDVKFTENLADSTKVEDRIRFARESFCTKFFRDKFVEHVLLNMDDGPDVIRLLDNGEMDVAEAFCAATSGTLSITMAARFRNARFFGFETNHVSLSRSRDLAKAADTKNARFYDVKERSLSFGPPPSLSKKHKVRPGYGLVLTFLSMSMLDADAQEALFREVRAGLDPTIGAWIIMDLDAEQDDLAYALCSGMALLHFMPSLESPAMCEPFNRQRCEELAMKTGFHSMTQLPPVKDDMLVRLNAFVLK